MTKTLAARLATAEKQIIIDALTANDWHKTATARELAIDRSTLYKLMRKLGIASHPIAYIMGQIALANNLAAY